ncbi:hydroxymethyltransferase [Auriculariales sp. MPI-PUGE-AT-0066]|nr:hydroxymethyltransferase [Auriculariales sp. MPI-PUGE-AT-0066]
MIMLHRAFGSTLRSRTSAQISSIFQKRYMAATPTDFNRILYTPLTDADPDLKDIIDKETWRQFSGIELIASENRTSRAAMEANGSILTNKYSEGLPKARYYGGNQYIDELEELCQARALKAFNLDPSSWGVNVQPYSGSTANFAALSAVLRPQDIFMGLGLPDGGHLAHGYDATKKSFRSVPYGLDTATGLIDYVDLKQLATQSKPRLIVCGASAYPRDWDYESLRAIANEHGAFLMADIAHTSGLLAAGTLKDPFAFCDIVTTTTHKTLRGARGGLVFFRNDGEHHKGLGDRVNEAVYPGCQGGPHNNAIAGVAAALHQAAQPEFKAYAQQVIKNAQALAAWLMGNGYKLQTNGTDNHIILWDLRPLNLTGAALEKVCEIAGISITKHTVLGDQDAQSPGGVRLGTSALTSRSLMPKDMETIGSFLHRAVQLSLGLQKKVQFGTSADFSRVASEDTAVKALAQEVGVFARSWPFPGVDTKNLKKPACLA